MHVQVAGDEPHRDTVQLGHPDQVLVTLPAERLDALRWLCRQSGQMRP